MNFDFSDEAKAFRDQAMKFMAEQSSSAAVRCVLDDDHRFDRNLWKQMAEIGWQGAAIPEACGGSESSDEILCVMAESLGRMLGTVPFATSTYLATQLLVAGGTEEQKQHYLPALADGTIVATFALVEEFGEPELNDMKCNVKNGCLSGIKTPVLDGDIADIVIVAAQDNEGGVGLYIADLSDRLIERKRLNSIDPTRGVVSLQFNNTPVQAMKCDDVPGLIYKTLDRAAILTAFEQVGGAQRCLEMACAYANEREAFGRLIGSYQGVKHQLARVMVAIELARSNAYYGALVLSNGTGDLRAAAAAARISASSAFGFAAAANLHIHGGIGYTWESDCHLFIKRAKLLSLFLGSCGWWKSRLGNHLYNEANKEHHGH